MTFARMDAGPTCVMDIDLGVLAERIKKNCKRELPWLHQLPEFNKSKGNHPIALCAGGWSLNDNLYELRRFDTLIACGSTHDHLIEVGFKPRYAVVSDPSPLVMEWLKRPNQTTTYLISTGCDDSVFEALKDYPVAMWNALGGVPTEAFGDIPAVGGGCTVGLRAMPIAVMLGYRNQHLFGFDSCYRAGVSHSYVADKGHRSDPSIQERILIRVGGPNGKEFEVSPMFLAQASNFKDMMKEWAGFFDLTIYGDGVLAEMLRTGETNENLQAA